MPTILKPFFVLVISFAAISGNTRALPGDVIITEVFTKSNGNLPDYIELFNTSTTIQNLSGWTVAVYGVPYVLGVPSEYSGPDESWADVYNLSPNAYMFITGADGFTVTSN